MLAKATGAEPSGQMRDEQLHAIVAQSTFPSQNVQNTQFSDHFWKFRCRKSAGLCGAKHISKSHVFETDGCNKSCGTATKTSTWQVQQVAAQATLGRICFQKVRSTAEATLEHISFFANLCEIERY